MDIREIIKWLIHGILQNSKNKFGFGFGNDRMFWIFIFLFINRACSAKNTSDVSESKIVIDDWTKNIDSLKLKLRDFGESQNVVLDYLGEVFDAQVDNDTRLSKEGARTFGRPFKKMMSALVPVIFQLGAASSWMVVAALVSFKGLLVGLAILKLLLLGGAAKIGALFASKVDHHKESTPPHKEVHLHIHNSPHGIHHEEYGGWSRDGQFEENLQLPVQLPVNKLNTQTIEPYAGPDVINTPFGSYVKIGPAHSGAHSQNT